MSQFRRVIRLTLSCMVMTLSFLQAKEPVASNAPGSAKVRRLLSDEMSDPEMRLADAADKFKNPKQEFGHRLKAAESGNSMAAFMVAPAYEVTDPAQALKWYLTSANAGNPAAQYYLAATSAGKLLSDAERHHWLLTLAERKDLRDTSELWWQIQAMVDVGRQFLEGRGTKENLPEAVRWFRAGADLGYDDAHRELARCLLHGKGVPRDEVAAYVQRQLYLKNKDRVRKEDEPEFEELKKKLTPNQLADARTRMREVTSQIDLRWKNLRSVGIVDNTSFICEPLPADWPTDFAIITAYTVYSQGGLPTTAAQNVAADKALEDELRSAGYRIHRINGWKWNEAGARSRYLEPGWGVQLDLPRAAGVGRRYGQKKVFTVSAGRLAIVDCNDGLAVDLGKVFWFPPDAR
jgi:Sel1 repeat